MSNKISINKLSIFIILNLFISLHVSGQIKEDTIWNQTLQTVQIKSYKVQIHEVQKLDAVHSGFVTTGKKNEVLTISDLPANLAEKNARQIFAKIPGAFVYDMDGSGNQVNLSTRGLDPHRSWEFNVRQNGIMTNSDIYGYPASHYSPPMEAIHRIEIIRGSGSLLYGAQFGGMINYITKQADTSRSFSLENITSVGSFGLLSNYTSIGGKKGKFSYFAYHQKRVSEGFRKNAESDSQAQFASLTYAFSSSIKLTAEMGRSQYLYRVPGPLSDAMFYEKARQSTRTRNYFNPDIYIPSLKFEWKLNANSTLFWTTSAVLGKRSSVQFIGFADVLDTIQPTSGTYKNRQVDIDKFNSYTSELKWVHSYELFTQNNTFIAGVRYIQNDLHRRQLGHGSTGSDYDLSITGAFGRDIHLKTKNIALFAENLIKLTKSWDLTLGVRYENGQSRMLGIISYLDDADLSKTINHNFPLFGAGTQWQLNVNHNLYAGWSQSYRPVIFADLIPGNSLEKTDPNMKDGFGHNLEIGMRGKFGRFITYDVNVFQILYKNRIGNQVLTDENNQNYVWRTNFGDSRTSGIELYMEGVIVSSDQLKASLFTASSYFHARYLNGTIRNGSENVDLTGNHLETVPKFISRNGLQIAYKWLTSILQYSYVSESYSDALNTVIPTKNGSAGIVPAYGIWDFNISFRINKNIQARFGISNILDKQYFTKRPSGYPGPGVWSSDGRGVNASIILRI